MSQDPPSPPGASFPRFHALDSVRAVVLLLGVVLHAILFGGGTAGLLGASPATSARVVDWIHSFRMPLFFMISGFFCHMMFVKHGAATYLARRWWRLGAPLIIYLFTVVGINQLTGYTRGFGFGPGAMISPQVVAQADTDRNKRVSPDEFAALADAWFDRLDTGKVGQVSREQFMERFGDLFPARHGSGPRRRAHPGGGPPGGLGSVLGRLVGPAFFTAVDENRDGLLTRGEWKASFARWHADWDSGGSGELTEEKIRRGLNAVLPRPGFGGSGAMPFAAPSPMAERLFGTLAPQFTLGPMWFLWYLIVFATIGPVVARAADWLIARRAIEPVDRAGRWALRAALAPAILALLSLPGRTQTANLSGWALGSATAAFDTFPDVVFRYQADWPFYFPYFFAGWWLFRMRSEMGAVARTWLPNLGMGLLAYFAAVKVSETYAPQTTLPSYDVIRLAGHALFAVSAAYTSFGLIGFFQRYVDRPARVARYLADTAFWIYLLHQELLVRVILPRLRPYELPWWLQTFIALVSVTLIAAVTFELLIRRTPLTDLFGPPRPRHPFPRRYGLTAMGSSARG